MAADVCFTGMLMRGRYAIVQLVRVAGQGPMYRAGDLLFATVADQLRIT